jgi:hypothetical protein
MANYQGVTLIQNLPELNDYKLPPPGGSHFERPVAGADPGAYSKYITNPGHNRLGNNDYSGMGAGPNHSMKNFDGYTGSGADMSGPGGYLRIPAEASEMYGSPPPATVTEHYNFEEGGSTTSADADDEKECSCRDVYDHVNGCNICKAFYMEGRSNFIYLLIITIMTIIIAILGSKCYTIHSR